LALRREAGQTVGIVALVPTGLALTGVLWLSALGWWQATFPVMVVLGPLQISLYGGWRWWHAREQIRHASVQHTGTQRARHHQTDSTIDYGNRTLAPLT
jgi:hypothetical protein